MYSVLTTSQLIARRSKAPTIPPVMELSSPMIAFCTVLESDSSTTRSNRLSCASSRAEKAQKQDQGISESSMLALIHSLTHWFTHYWKVSDPEAKDFLGLGGFNLIRAEFIGELSGFPVSEWKSFVRPFALLELDLLEFAHRHPAPPPVSGFPPQPEVTLRGNAELHREISVHHE